MARLSSWKVLVLAAFASVLAPSFAVASPVDVEPFGPAGQPDTWLAVSMLSDATARACSAQPCFALTLVGNSYAQDGFAVSGRTAQQEGGGYAIAGGDADSPSGTAVSVNGDANGAVAFSALGKCNGRKCIDVAPAGSADGSFLAVGSKGATSDGLALSQGGDARGRYAVSETGNAYGQWAASGTRDAYGVDLAASGTGRAQAASTEAMCRLAPPLTNGATTMPCGIALALMGDADSNGLFAVSALGDAHTGTCYYTDPSKPTCGVAASGTGDASNGPCWDGTKMVRCGLLAVSLLGSASSGGLAVPGGAIVSKLLP